MAARIFLALSALLWLPYGLFCFAQPGFLAGAAGVAATTPTGTVELRAMYGGLQAGLGALALIGALRSGWRRHALAALACLCAGLGMTRLAAGLIAADFSSYTLAGLVVEWLSAGIALVLLRGPDDAARERGPR